MQTVLDMSTLKGSYGMYRLVLRRNGESKMIDGQYFHNSFSIATEVLAKMQAMVVKAGMNGSYVMEQNPIYNIRGSIQGFKKAKFSFTNILLN